MSQLNLFENASEKKVAPTITITGSRDIARDWVEQQLEQALTPYLKLDAQWYVGGARGVDAWALQWLLDRNEQCVVVVPFKKEDQPKSVQEILSKVETMVELDLPRSKSAYHQRNHYMVDRSDIVVGFWNGEKGGTASTLDYAQKKGRKVEICKLTE